MSSERPRQAFNPAERSPYDLEGVDREMVKKFRPEFIAVGGEHIVYGIPEKKKEGPLNEGEKEEERYRDVVVKVNVSSVREILDANARNGRRPDALTEGIKKRVEELLQREAEQYRAVKAHFGAEHVLNQKKFLLKVPMTESVLREIYGGWAPPASGEVWGIVMVQKRADLESPEHLSMDTNGYPELRALSRETYEESTRHLLYGDESLGMSGKEALLGLLGSGGDNMRSLIARAEHDSELKAMLKDLAEKMISYFEKTGVVFDMVGDDNIAVMKEGGHWTYKFVDAIYPGGGDMRAGARNAILNLAQGEVVDKFDRNDLMNTLNFVRTVNGLAGFTGSDKRIRIIPDEVYDTYIDFQEELKND